MYLCCTYTLLKFIKHIGKKSKENLDSYLLCATFASFKVKVGNFALICEHCKLDWVVSHLNSAVFFQMAMTL